MWLSGRGVCGTQTINISTVCSPSRTPTPPEPQEYSEVDKNIFKSPTVAKYANIWMIALLLGQLHTHVAHKQLQTSRGVSWRGTNMHTCSDYIKSIPVNILYTHPASQTMWCKYTHTHTLTSEGEAESQRNREIKKRCSMCLRRNPPLKQKRSEKHVCIHNQPLSHRLKWCLSAEPAPVWDRPVLIKPIYSVWIRPVPILCGFSVDTTYLYILRENDMSAVVSLDDWAVFHHTL